MKNALLLILISVSLFAPVFSVSAETKSREVLMAELQSLLQQLITLQSKLTRAQYTNVRGESTERLQPSKYYSGIYEAIYYVDGTSLRPYGATITSQSDLELFEVLRIALGDRVVSNYITEFRIYNDEDAEFDAFVEQIGEGDDWIFGVNTAVIGTGTSAAKKAAIALFVHEYGHIIYHYNDGIRSDFENTFWEYRSKYAGDYVSAYAMIDSQEDFAESFMYFALNERPSGSLIRNEKVQFFYTYDFLRTIRNEIQNRQ